MKFSVFSLMLTALIFLSACQGDDIGIFEDLTNSEGSGTVLDPVAIFLDMPDEPFNYTDLDYPDHFLVDALPGPNNNAAIDTDSEPVDNPVTDAGAALGRVLFYDKNLSQNRSTSCASCHQADHGLSDLDVLSEGFNGGLTGRHSMALTNARFNPTDRYFWDFRAATLEEQVLMPFQDPVEMGMTLEEIVSTVQASPYYPPLFEEAFDDPAINAENIAKALAQFVRSMVSYSSKYDEGRVMVNNPQQPFPNFTPSENRGKFLFFAPIPNGGAGCLGCHATEAFIGIRPENNGLDQDSADDPGFFDVTGNPQDHGKFRVPSLRNVALRPPFMHDGRFETLEEVIEHYSTGVQNHPNLGPPLRQPNGTVLQLNLPDSDKEALIAFLETLSDPEMLSDPKFSSPFK